MTELTVLVIALVLFLCLIIQALFTAWTILK